MCLLGCIHEIDRVLYTVRGGGEMNGRKEKKKNRNRKK